MSPEKRRPQRPGGIFEAMVPPCAGLAVTAVTPRGDTREGGGAEHQHPGVGIHPWQEKGGIPAKPPIPLGSCRGQKCPYKWFVPSGTPQEPRVLPLSSTTHEKPLGTSGIISLSQPVASRRAGRKQLLLN